MQETLLKLISLGTIGLLIFCFSFVLINFFGIHNPLKKLVAKHRMDLLFVISLMGTVGSILLSVYFKLEPCELCWYQRMFLFGTPIITGLALHKKDVGAHVYVFWLSFVGLMIALYHSLIQLQFFAPNSVFCSPSSAVDCAIAAFTYYGFVTIPVISFSVFLLLVIISYDYKKI